MAYTRRPIRPVPSTIAPTSATSQAWKPVNGSCDVVAAGCGSSALLSVAPRTAPLLPVLVVLLVAGEDSSAPRTAPAGWALVVVGAAVWVVARTPPAVGAAVSVV